MRMFEELLAGQWPDVALDRKYLLNAQPYLIDNVSEYFYAQTDQETWDVKTDFPCLAPPSPEFWMEYSRPSKIVSKERGVQDSSNMPHRVGMLFIYKDFDEKLYKEGMENNDRERRELAIALEGRWSPDIDMEVKHAMEAGANLRDRNDPIVKSMSLKARTFLQGAIHYWALGQLANRGKFEEVANIRRDQGARWFGVCFCYMQQDRGFPVVGPLCHHMFYVNGDGSMIDSQYCWHPEILAEESAEGASTFWFSALLAISFCHCKNVTVCPEEKPAKLVRRQAERGIPQVTFKVLQIDPMRKVLSKTAAELGGGGLKRALHICRGHFAVYEERPLFGKVRGRFWIPQHLRGQPESGLAEKVYNVKHGKKEKLK
jgi:hypothetical protein